MKKKGLIWLTTFLFVICISSLAEASYKWSQVGRAPLMPKVEDKISLQEQFSLYKIEIIDGLKMAEPAWDASRVFKLSESSIRSDINVEEVAFPRGQKFSWMIFKGKKGISVLRDVEWVGKEPLLGFLYSCVYEGLEIKFFLPKKCGNLTLVETKSLPPAPTPKVEITPPRVEAPPPPPQYVQPQPVDVCPNIEGVQTVVPQGLVKDQYGNCVIMQVQVDVCANIEGIQTRVPESMIQDSYGNCVVRQYSYYPPPREEPYVYSSPPPSPPPAVSYFPLPLPFLGDDFYRDDFYSPRYHPPRYHPPRYHPPRYHPPRYHPPRVRPPTVRTVPPAVRPPTVRTVPPAVRPPTVRTVSSRGSSSSMSRGSTSRSPGVRTR